MEQMEISLVFEDNLYKVKIAGELTYNYPSISKVEEMFGVDMAAYFTDAIREACRNNGIIKKKIGKPAPMNDEFFDKK